MKPRTQTQISDGSPQTETVTREEMVRLLNEDLAREYQAIIAYVVYSQVLKGAQYMSIAGELENLLRHHEEELWPEIERLARENVRFRRALSAAWAYDSPVFEQRNELLEELT